MPARSKVLALPRDVKRRLDELLVEKGFSDYRGFAKWLTEQGHPMSHMAVQRYGSQFERRIESIRMSSEMAAALVAASPDDPGVVADASIQLVQERMFQVLLASEGGDLTQLSTAGRALSEATRASIAIRADRRKALDEASKAADSVGRKPGMSKDTAAAIRAVIEGME